MTRSSFAQLFRHAGFSRQSKSQRGYQIDSISGIYKSSTMFVDKELGFGFKIPSNWHLQTFRDDFNLLLKRQKLAKPYSEDKSFLENLGQGLIIKDHFLVKFNPVSFKMIVPSAILNHTIC